MFRSAAGTLAAIVVALSSLAHAAEIETARGPVTIDKVPGKIAVYDIAAIDTLNRLGVSIAGLPEKIYVPELAELTKSAQPIGTLFEPDLEALSALAPDLIIVGSRSAPKFDATSKVATTIDMTIGGDDLVTESKQRLAAFGTLFGKEKEAADIATGLDTLLAETRAAAKGKGNVLLVMTNGPKIMAYGKGSRFGWVHSVLELPPAVEKVDVATHGEAVSFEFVAKANPDWMIVIDRAAAVGADQQNARTTLDNELVAGTTAWRKGQVIYVPSADFYIAAGGVQSLTRVLETVKNAFAQAK